MKENALAEYERYIIWKAKCFCRNKKIRIEDYEDYAQVGRISVSFLPEKEYKKPYVMKTIINAMKSFYIFNERKNRRILTYAESLLKPLTEDSKKRLIDVIKGYDFFPEPDDNILDFIDSALLKLPEFEKPEKRKYRVNLKKIDRNKLSEFSEKTGADEDDVVVIANTEYSIDELYDSGLSVKEINLLVEDGILVGEKSSHYEIIGEKLSKKYQNKEFREKMRKVLLENVKKAQEALKIKYQDADFCKHMKSVCSKNMKKAKVVGEYMYRNNPEFREFMYNILVENAKNARKAKDEKLKEPEYKKKFIEAVIPNLDKARERIDELSENPEWNEKRKKALRKSIKHANRIGHEMFRSDPEYRNAVIISRRNGRRKRMEEDPVYRELCKNLWKVSAMKRREKSYPRRNTLLNEVIIPNFGRAMNAKPSEVLNMLETRYRYILDKFYDDCVIENRLRDDIRELRKSKRVVENL